MSTNFYFINKNSRKEVSLYNREIQECAYEVAEKLRVLGVDEYKIFLIASDFGKLQKEEETIHIGKRSVGWIPLFHSDIYFSNMKELRKWYEENKENYIIENEYRVELTWEELNKELFEWKGSNMRENSFYMNYYYDDEGFQWTRNEFL